MARAEKVIEALKRAADEALAEASEKALLVQAQAGAHGRLGGSPHLEGLSRACFEGFANVVSRVTAAIDRFDPTQAQSYRAPFEDILKRSVPRLIEIFKDHAEMPSFGWTAEEELEDLRRTLTSSVQVALDEFALSNSRSSGGDDGDLDAALEVIGGSHLVSLRRGAWVAASSDQLDSVRQAAHSARELIGQVLDALAPVDEVKKQHWYVPASDSRPALREGCGAGSQPRSEESTSLKTTRLFLKKHLNC